MDFILTTEKSKDYELLDSGNGEKLERFGNIILSRPDPQVLWSKKLDKTDWDLADAVFSHTGTAGKWRVVASSQHLVSREKSWEITLEGITFSLQLLPSKHIGVFPEQSAHWRWLYDKVYSKNKLGEKVSVLNLFGYTGGASFACAMAGASVCHVDSSRFAIDLANKNQNLSGLSDRPIRFIVDDVRKFVEREIKRGNKYDIIILDPPVYGKGSKKEVWKIEKDLMLLLSRLKNILSKKPTAIILNGYSSVYSSTTYGEMLREITDGFKGKISHGSLVIKESSGQRLLSCGIFAKFEFEN